MYFNKIKWQKVIRPSIWEIKQTFDSTYYRSTCPNHDLPVLCMHQRGRSSLGLVFMSVSLCAVEYPCYQVNRRPNGIWNKICLRKNGMVDDVTWTWQTCIMAFHFNVLLVSCIRIWKLVSCNCITTESLPYHISLKFRRVEWSYGNNWGTKFGNLRLPGTYAAIIDENQTPLHVSLNNSVTRP